MKLPTKGRYADGGISRFGVMGDTDLVSLNEISRSGKIFLPYLEQLL